MELFRAFAHSLTKPRTLHFIESWRKHTAFFKPSDWLIAWTLIVIMGMSAATMLAGVSLALTTKVPAQGGTYTEGVVGTPRFVNPLLAISEADRDLSSMVYSGLLRRNPDGTLVPDVAESYEMSEDKRTYTVVISNEARFHDGKPVTADDVVYTVREAQTPEVKSPRRADWEGVSVQAVDEKTVSFTLSAPYPPFLENLTMGILPKHLWSGVSSEEFAFTTLNEHPVGSGAYKIEAIRENSSGIPVEYRLQAFRSGTRSAFIDKFIFRFYPNEDELKKALERGEVSAASSIDPSGVLGGRVAYEAVFGRIFGIFFNQSQNPVFADSAVRRALDTAVDKQRIIDTILNGYGSVIDGPLPPETILPAGSPVDAEARLQEARDILAKAGWSAGDDGVLAKTEKVKGKNQTSRLVFSLTTSNAPELKRAAEMAAEDWRALGADVSLKFFEQNDLNIEVIRPRKYDALLFGEVVGREPDLFAFWHSSQRNDPGLNIGLYASTDADKKLEAARTSDDPGIRREKAKAAAKEIEDDVAAVFLYAPHFVYLAPKTVSGIVLGTVEAPSDRFDSADQWYLSTENVWPVFTLDAKTFTSIFAFIKK